MYKFLFGPVPSRRLGMSLGIDLVPRKVCSLDCVYCEVGKTTKLTLERKEYIPFGKVISELTHYFENNPDPDYITFSGSGEPTLNSRIGDVLKFIKEKKPKIPIALLTNGTLFFDPEVRAEINRADVVLPSLDAATNPIFQKINRPVPGFDIEKYLQGLIDFRKEFKGKIWLEIFILPEFNLEQRELKKLEEAIIKINPDSIQLNTLDRPGTVADLHPASREELEGIVQLWNLENVEIISPAAQRKDILSYRSDAEEAIFETISRRPCTIEDLMDILGIHINEINKYLDVLEDEKKIESIRQKRGIFYQVNSHINKQG
ncbi:MAG: radical SAM protein [Deltaproteobacteria bacterium]|nr:MAG: radical SAM protein [Deltaproteobacteria bacterium]